MHVAWHDSFDTLAPLAAEWEALAGGVPFRGYAWSSTWWRHYGEQRHLNVAVVRDDSAQVIGIAPWHVERSASGGAVLRWLGSGEVCADYLSLLCRPEHEAAVTNALAASLVAPRSRTEAPRWHVLDLTGVDAQDTAVAALEQALALRGCATHRRAGLNCWRLALPADWASYEALLSKSHRKQVRRLHERWLASGRAVLRTVEQPDQLARGLELLVDLHQRRRASLGQPGCFSRARFAAFHRDVAARLLATGQLRMHWIELDGEPVAAEYHLAGGGVVYGYQSGVDPARLAEEPGRIAAIATLRRALEQGFREFDFLRGDEPYKAHWRAVPRPAVELRIAAPQAAARLRHGAWLAGQAVKSWAKSQRRAATEAGAQGHPCAVECSQ